MTSIRRFVAPSPGRRSPRDSRHPLASRFLLGLLLWWILTEGGVQGLAFGAAAAALAAWLSLKVFPPVDHHPRWSALPGFALFFARRSVSAGIDVARRLLLPSLPVQPGIVAVDSQLPDGRPRWLLANTLSLLPGTVSVELRGRQLELHVLDLRTDIERSVRETEARIAALFGLPGAGGR